MTYSKSQKSILACKLADIVLDLAECQFPLTGDPADLSSAPTVEGSKIFKGRLKFHRSECYKIDPYKSLEEYVPAYYDKETYYYENAGVEDIDEDFFEEEGEMEAFLKQLKEERI